MKINQSCVARRRFLCGMIGGGAVALGAGVAGPLAQYAGNLQEKPPPDSAELDKDDYDLADGESKIVMYGGSRIPILIFKVPSEKEPRLFVAICTHFDCTVSYKEDENRIFCACHDGYYFIDGEVESGPPPAPLQKVFSRPKGDKLVIALKEENLEKAFDES